MGRYIEQNESQSEFQQRLAADLQRRAREKAQQSDAKTPDGVKDAAYLKGTKSTTSLAWVWVLIFVMAIAVFIYFIIRVNQ